MGLAEEIRAPEPDALSASEAMEATGGPDFVDQDALGDAAATYGTRSRNRGGNARPNYAEDKDLDADMYDYYPQDKKGTEPKKSTRQFNAAQDAPRGGASTRKSLSDEAKPSSHSGITKDQAVGSTAASPSQSAPSAGVAPPTRKRKAVTQQAASSSGSTPAAPSTRRAAAANGNENGNGNAPSRWPESNVLTFENCGARPQNGRLIADDGTVLMPNDHVYLVCEPPGDPYYLARIMEFSHEGNDPSRRVDSLRINWYYRPKDIGRKVQDTRLVIATMHSDYSPLTALRGKCTIRHRHEIKNMEAYRRMPDSFWYEKLYDRYIQKNFDLIPTSTIINVPDKVKKVLHDRWKFVLVEQGNRGKELTSAVKLCKRCSAYCASTDSVDCAVCEKTYHMNCVSPPLLKKPARGFAWSCAACSRAQERRLETQNAPGTHHGDADDEEMPDGDEDEVHVRDMNTPTQAEDGGAHHQGTAEQIHQASLWPYRYLGIHCEVEDALDYDDRIYPRASNRIGLRHQANVASWPGRPVEYEKPTVFKKPGKKDAKLSKELQAAQEAEKARREKRPKWVQDEPAGYVARGEDSAVELWEALSAKEPDIKWHPPSRGKFNETDGKGTAKVLWKPPPANHDCSRDLPGRAKSFMEDCMKDRTPEANLPASRGMTNYGDLALEAWYWADYQNTDAATRLKFLDRRDQLEPRFTPTERKKFEEGVAKYGSELNLVKKHVKSVSPGMIVRFYYAWKKTEEGKAVWGNYTGRKGKKEAKKAEAAAAKTADDVADGHDDSAFDAGKAAEKKRKFMCQFCATTKDRQWRRAPHSALSLALPDGTKPATKDKADQYIAALCRRCAELWRRYGVRYEEVDEATRKAVLAGGKGINKRRQDEELIRELQAAQDWGFISPDRDTIPLGPAAPSANGQEPPRKKLKGAAADKEKKTQDERENSQSDASASASASRKDQATPEIPAVPEIPKQRVLPCAICNQMEPQKNEHVSCRECRLTVHRKCYGVSDSRVQGKWTCEMCSNDKNPQVSIHYKCVLCPVEKTEHDFVGPSKLSHHKKKMTDKEREREKFEVQQARKAADYYRKKQEDSGRPVNPREPLKRTADNNWVHVTCAVWTPEVKFANAKAIQPAEGIPLIPRAKYEEVCQACSQTGGACVACHQCRTPLHVECARQQGYLLGFDITPVKSSRRDQHNIVSFKGESGTMSAAIWCKDHVPIKTVVHRMHDIVDDQGLNALQLYVQKFKQADLTLTGTVRKANMMTMAAKVHENGTSKPLGATVNGVPITVRTIDLPDTGCRVGHHGDKVCCSCGIDVSPKWWPVEARHEDGLANGTHQTIGSEAQKFVEQRKFQCHKCRRRNKAPVTHSILAEKAPEPTERLSLSEHELNALPGLRSPPNFPPVSPFATSSLFGPPPPEPRPGPYAWPQPQAGYARAVATSPPAHHLSGQPSRVAPRQLSYTRPSPPQQPYNEWPPPGPQRSSPEHHINGGPPPLHHGPPGSNPLRPGSMSGPVPPARMSIPSPRLPYTNGVPHSPQLNGPTPPSPYTTTYHPSPQRNGHHGHSMSNGGPPPPPLPHYRSEEFSLFAPPRPSFPGPHHSPPGSRSGIPGAEGAARPGDSRPSTGASTRPSLRDLLS